MTTVKLGLLPTWNPQGAPTTVRTHVAAIIQAYHTAAFVQKVKISGPGLAAPIIAQSDPAKPFGTSFLSREIPLPPEKELGFPLFYDVELKYLDENNRECDPAVLAVQGTQLGPTCVTAFAFSNDRNGGQGDDADYNDTVVSISLFPYSRD